MLQLQTHLKTKAELEQQMLLVRLLEDRLQELCLQGLGADLHFSRGQEAISTGVCSVLAETDYVVTHHRTIAHAIAKGVPLKPLVAEILGKAEGINGGMAGEMHMSYLPKRFMFSWQLVGTCISVAAGLAWAVKNHLCTKDIVVVFFGDAATANAQFHEALNIAAVQKVPLLLVCENNHLAGNVTPEYYSPVQREIQRAAAYGIVTSSTNGNDLGAVVDTARAAAHYVRANSRPMLLECTTARLGRHKQGMGDIRSKAELEVLSQQDPLRRIDVAPDVREHLQREIESVIQEVLAGPDPVLRRE